jgi:S1-C subfamily serine protease
MTNSDNPLVALSNAMANAVEKASAFTVMVDARRRLPSSGIAYTADLVLTADHTVERDDDIYITLPNGDRVTAELVGRDPGSDLALLRLKGVTLDPAKPAAQSARLGQMVLAVGRPSEEGIQASLGVVSAIGGPVRTGRGGLLEQYLRTDTIAYPGFSGGPLIDSSAGLLGVNTSGLARGVALTIPLSLAWSTAQTLSQHGRVRRGYLGIRSQQVELADAQQQALSRKQELGLLLVGIENNSPASMGGLLVGDILVGLGGKSITDPDQLLMTLAGQVVGQATQVEILRGSQLNTVQVTIGERR